MRCLPRLSPLNTRRLPEGELPRRGKRGHPGVRGYAPRNDSGSRRLVRMRRYCIPFSKWYCGTVMTVPYGFPSRAGGTAPADQPGQPPKVGSLRNPSKTSSLRGAQPRGNLLIRRTAQERAEDKHRSWPPFQRGQPINCYGNLWAGDSCGKSLRIPPTSLRSVTSL